MITKEAKKRMAKARLTKEDFKLPLRPLSKEEEENIIRVMTDRNIMENFNVTQTSSGTFLVEGTMEALEKLFYIKGRTVRLSCGNLWSIGKRGGKKHIGEWNGTTVEINKKSLFEIKVNYDY